MVVLVEIIPRKGQERDWLTEIFGHNCVAFMESRSKTHGKEDTVVVTRQKKAHYKRLRVNVGSW